MQRIEKVLTSRLRGAMIYKGISQRPVHEFYFAMMEPSDKNIAQRAQKNESTSQKKKLFL